MKYIVYCDQGHSMTTAGKRTPVFNTSKAGSYNGKQMREREFNRATGVYLMEFLNSLPNIDVVDVSPTGNETLAQRCNKANSHYKQALVKHGKSNVKSVFVSIHANALTGDWGSAKGIETYYYEGSEDGKKLASLVNSNLCAVANLPNRGIKTNSLYVVSNTSMTAILCECGFMDNLNEALLLISDSYRKSCAKAIFNGICSYFSISTTPKADTPAISNTSQGFSILTKSTSTVAQMQEWAKSKGASPVFINNANLYYSLGQEYGINHSFAYCQYSLETNFGKYGGVINESFCNPCGMKTTKGGGDKDPNAHMKFKTWEDGIRAHYEHLALYIGKKGYPLSNPKDPRHFPYLLGTADSVDTLCKKWATDSATYAKTVLQRIDQISNTKVKPTESNLSLGEVLVLFPDDQQSKGRIIEGSTYVPIRDLCNILDLDITFDNKTKTVYIRRRD